MGTVGAIGWLLGGHGEQLPDEREIEAQQDGPVKEQRAAFAALGVAGEFPVLDSKVGVTLDCDVGVEEGLEGLPVLFHDKAVCARDGGQSGGVVDAQDEGVIQTTWALDDGASTGTAPKDGDLSLAADWDIGLESDRVGIAEDDEGDAGFPEAQHLLVLGIVAAIQESFVTGQIGCGRGEGEVQVFHL